MFYVPFACNQLERALEFETGGVQKLVALPEHLPHGLPRAALPPRVEEATTGTAAQGSLSLPQLFEAREAHRYCVFTVLTLRSVSNYTPRF